jgi:hypothetical protein
MSEKPSRGAGREGPADPPVYAYELGREAFDDRVVKSLPEDARLIVLTPKPLTASKFAKRFKLKRTGGAIVRRQARQPAAKIDVGSDAYRPDAKARALLRGVKMVEQDLRSSGGAYSLSEVQTLMRDVSRQAVNSRVREGSLLAVPGPSNRACYPAVQFTSSGGPVVGLKEVRQALGTGNSWALLNFLVNSEPKLNGRRPIDLMKDGELSKVLEVALAFGIQGA